MAASKSGHSTHHHVSATGPLGGGVRRPLEDTHLAAKLPIKNPVKEAFPETKTS